MEQNSNNSIAEMRMQREVFALRDALEQAQMLADQRSTHAAANHRAEVDELQEMIRRLRDRIDAERASHAEAVAEQRRTLATEIRALQKALSDARAVFDAERLTMQADHQAAQLADGRVRAELEATVRQLREQLDVRR